MAYLKVVSFVLCIVSFLFGGVEASVIERNSGKAAVEDLLRRVFGENLMKSFVLELKEDSSQRDYFSIKKKGKKVFVKGSSPVALVRGVYYYLKNYCNCIVSWSGSNLKVPDNLPDVEKSVSSPYRYRYYFNVVTHGYTTAYWGWKRWEKEIDWMGVHGINMPLIPGAHEAILYRVFRKLGLTDKEAMGYFSGPAHFPWNRMGNLVGWDGGFPFSYFKKQIALTHKILKRLRALGMKPVIHSFAGFVPDSIRRIKPRVKVKELGWGGGLKRDFNSFILPPDSREFVEIGKLYIEEWEREFGKGEFYLADSFNEMDVPVSADPDKGVKELANYGESVYRSIKEGNSDAVWVMQGWTFPYHRGKDGKKFWTADRLKALVSKVPDDKLLILDLANEYNRVFWKIDPSWKTYEGFFNKMWIYSFIPNMGGKVPLNGRLDIYASIPVEALNYKGKKNLVGFGFAPEGIENNEIIYELLSDMSWRKEKVDLRSWIGNYCVQRYGGYPVSIKKAYELLNNSCFGSFTDHPMHRYQLRPYDKPEGVENHATVHKSREFEEAVGYFLKDADKLKVSKLYRYDAIELVVQFLGLVVDRKILLFLDEKKKVNKGFPEEIKDILLTMDRLLESHPNHKLSRWIEFARKWGDSEKEKNYYESNAKRLLTTWGGDPVCDYSGRVWSGLIRDYYVPRWINYHEDRSQNREINMRKWEEGWIRSPGMSTIKAFKYPLKVAVKYYKRYIGNR